MFTVFGEPKGDSNPSGPGVNSEGSASYGRRVGESMVRDRQANPSGGAPWVPGCSDSRIMTPEPNRA